MHNFKKYWRWSVATTLFTLWAMPAHAGFVAPIVAAVVAWVAPVVVAAAVTYVVEEVVEAVFGKEVTDARDDQAAMAQATTAARALLVNKNSNNAEIPVIYGKLRTGGTRVYVETSDNAGSVANSEAGNEYFNCIIVMCEGQMGNIKQLYFDDELVWNDSTTLDGSNGRYILANFTGSYGDLNASGNKIIYHDGRDGQTHESELTSSVGSGEWPSTCDLNGLAYLYIRLKADAEKYAGGLPLFTAVLQSKYVKDVSTIVNANNYSNTISYSNGQNAVDLIYDYLTDTTYGKGLDHDSNGNYSPGLNIDIDSFKAARIDAAARGHYLNGTLSTKQRIYENIQRLTSSCNSILTYGGGKYKLKIQKPNETATFQFTEDNIIGNVTVTKGSKTNRLNKISTGFSDEDKKYVDNIVITKNATYLAEDNGTVLETTTDQQLITDSSRISTMNTYKLNKSRNQMAISFSATHQALVVECGDIVGVTQAPLDMNQKLFRIMSIELNEDNTINMQAVEYVSSIQV